MLLLPSNANRTQAQVRFQKKTTLVKIEYQGSTKLAYKQLMSKQVKLSEIIKLQADYDSERERD